MSICTRCGAVFSCGMVEGAAGPCWCMELPALAAGALPLFKNEAAGNSCFCPDCLRAAISASPIDQHQNR
jgi:hypothetical protein